MMQGCTRQEVDELRPWFHNLHLPDGTQTAPDHFLGDFPSFKWDEIARYLPADLHGWTVLDVGCNAGFYSFQMARRGARVTAIDSSPHYLRQAQWAARQYGLTEHITFRQAQVYSLAHDPGNYDLVLFLGVLYHLRYPLLALDILSRKTNRMLYLQSLSLSGSEVHPGVEDMAFEERQIMLDPTWPKAAFVEQRFAADPTVWWVPNRACMEAMLRDCGMRLIAHPGTETYLCEPDPDNRQAAEDRSSEEYTAALGFDVDPAEIPGQQPEVGT